MARKSDKSSTKAGFREWSEDVQGQFRGLSLRDGAAWPVLPRILLFAFIAAAVLVALWYFWLRHADEDLTAAREQEVKLKTEFQTKLQKAASLEELKKQRAQVAQYVAVLEKQLPGKAEMDALLSDINQAGLGRSLQFDLFKPGQLVVKDYYAELPIALKVAGRYHDLGSFTADIADLSRIVTLNNLAIGRDAADKSGTGLLVMQATAKTFRYLDPDEIAAQRQATNQPGAKKK